MTSVSADTAQTAEDAVAALYEDSSEDAMTTSAKVLARAIGACAGADALEGLLARPYISDLFGMGMPSLPLWPPVVDAILSLAESLLLASDAARVLGWARWCCSASPTAIVRPDVDPSLIPTERALSLSAFGARAPLYRQWLADASAERRAGGAHALAWCTKVTTADTDLLIDCATAESDGMALGSALLSLGVLVRRLGEEIDGDAALTLARATLSHPEPFARAGAGAALALMGQQLSTKATCALTDVVVQRVPLPAGWGWRDQGHIAHESDALACAVLNWASTAAGQDAVRSLASVEPRRDEVAEAHIASAPAHLGLPAPSPQFLPVEELLTGALAHLAFTTRGIAPHRYGLVAADLDEMQRAALEAMGRRAPRAAMALRRVGLYADPSENIVQDFLAGEIPEWRPVNVVIDDRPTQWHFGPLWGATIFGEVAVDDACKAIHASMTPAEAVGLVTRFTNARMIAYEQIKEPVAWERDQALALAVIDKAVERGFNLDDMMLAVAANKRSGLPAIAAVAYLRAHPDDVPEDYRQVIDDGFAQTLVAEPLRSLVAALNAR